MPVLSPSVAVRTLLTNEMLTKKQRTQIAELIIAMQQRLKKYDRRRSKRPVVKASLREDDLISNVDALLKMVNKE